MSCSINLHYLCEVHTQLKMIVFKRLLPPLSSTLNRGQECVCKVIKQRVSKEKKFKVKVTSVVLVLGLLVVV